MNCSKKIGTVGKGLLFDTGGYNIKTGMMELMKFDCGGSVRTIFNTYFRFCFEDMKLTLCPFSFHFF